MFGKLPEEWASVKVIRTDSPDPLIDVARADRLDEFHNDDSANERITGIGRRTYNGQTVERSYDLTFTEEKPSVRRLTPGATRASRYGN